MKIQRNSLEYNLDQNEEYLFICAKDLNSIFPKNIYNNVDLAVKEKKDNELIFVFEKVNINSILPSVENFINMLTQFSLEQVPSLIYNQNISIFNTIENIPEFEKMRKSYKKLLKESNNYYVPGMYLGTLKDEI